MKNTRGNHQPASRGRTTRAVLCEHCNCFFVFGLPLLAGTFRVAACALCLLACHHAPVGRLRERCVPLLRSWHAGRTTFFDTASTTHHSDPNPRYTTTLAKVQYIPFFSSCAVLFLSRSVFRGHEETASDEADNYDAEIGKQGELR